MAKKPNYQFEKRQKELARQARKEEKKLRKQSGQEDDESQAGTEDGQDE